MLFALLSPKFNPSCVSDPSTFLWIAISAADAASVNSNGIKTRLASGVNVFPIKGNTVLSNGPESLPKNFPDCPTLYNWVLDNFILSDEPSVKALQKLV